LQARGVDVVVRLHQARRADFRRGRRLGREDHLVAWAKPVHVPEWMSRAEYDAMPDRLAVRELRVRVRDRAKRVRELVVATTLSDAARYPAGELAGLYRQRWHAELDLRSLMTTMCMEMLRTRSPGMVRKEVAAHLLAYNLVRSAMGESARLRGLDPDRVSLVDAVRWLIGVEEADASVLGVNTPGRGRVEPRAVKRRPKKNRRLSQPRAKLRKRLLMKDF
jgi:hypothetical protein